MVPGAMGNPRKPHLSGEDTDAVTPHCQQSLVEDGSWEHSFPDASRLLCAGTVGFGASGSKALRHSNADTGTWKLNHGLNAH